MAYSLNPGKPPEEEMKRILFERIDDSIAHLEQPRDDLDEAVHEVRKNTKKIRGLLRLFRDALQAGNYAELNGYYRDFSRRFAGLRDAKVYLETMENLDKEDQVPGQVERVTELLAAHYKQTRGMLLDQKEFLTKSYLELQNSKQQIERLKLSKPVRDHMRRGLRRVYRRGRNAMGEATGNPDGTHFHEWRKRVKYLWYHVRLMQNAWPEVIKGYKKALDKLSDDLGDEHDLFVLKHLILDSEFLDVVPEEDRRKLTAVIDSRRKEIRDEAWPAGRKIYLEKPGDFSGRILGYWKLASGGL